MPAVLTMEGVVTSVFLCQITRDTVTVLQTMSGWMMSHVSKMSMSYITKP